MKQLLLSTLLLIQVQVLLAQSQPSTLPRMYFFVPNLLNPAMAGLEEEMTVSVLHQRQMTQIAAGPQTQVFSINNGFAEYNTGLGINLFRDQNGPLSLTSAEGAFSYKVNYDKNEDGTSNHYVSFGLSAGIQLWQLNVKDLDAFNDDPVFMLQGESKPSLSASFGMLYFYEGFQGGFSVQNIAGGRVRPLSAFDELVQEPTGFFLIGFENKLGENFRLNPLVVASLDFSGNIQADLNLIAELDFDNGLGMSAGVGYRMASRYKESKPEGLMFYSKTEYKGFNLSVQYNYPTGNQGVFTGGEYTIGLGFTTASFGGTKKTKKKPDESSGSEN
ncbi:MAG: PorP/SprF family type IX secretion system membrane protein [Saprospiraceae bacterium]|jgi:type IX secretion system PorP/SprF family membrane protein|nr:PorP/SprF family type IX secretion system membrane protein [Saprospiraceae bacterium]MDP4819607.1 PorP/SprF family type IX secretion system membrane protein [Saprospiraceae bacterium]MDP4997775.1 PorP/SprF family type IX secretion system membrane protein [Saprospiraceae bacterium]